MVHCFPGYIADNGPIPSWAASNNARAGLNPSGGSPFADTGAVPDGTHVAFIQSARFRANRRNRP